MSTLHPDLSVTCSSCGDTFVDIYTFRLHRIGRCRTVAKAFERERRAIERLWEDLNKDRRISDVQFDVIDKALNAVLATLSDVEPKRALRDFDDLPF